MPRIPAATAPIARAFLSQLGLDPDVIDDSGDLDLSDLAGELVYDVTIETAIAPAQRIKVRKERKAEIIPPPGPPRKKKKERRGAGDRLARFLQPAITLRGPYGEKRFAPFGRPDPDAWKRLAWKAGVGAVAALGIFALGGYLLGRWTAPRGSALSGGAHRAIIASVQRAAA